MKTFLLTGDEVGYLLALASKLDADRYKSPEVKAVIYKAKAVISDPLKYDRVQLVD